MPRPGIWPGWQRRRPTPAFAGASFLVRIGWRSVVLLHADRRPLDLLALLAGLPPDRTAEIPVQLADGARHRRPVAAALTGSAAASRAAEARPFRLRADKRRVGKEWGGPGRFSWVAEH